MASYLSIIFIGTFLAWINNKIKTKQNILEKMSILFLIIIASIRYEFGIDFISYYSAFNNYKYGIIDERLEVGFMILLDIFTKFNFRAMLVFISIINIVCFYKFIKYFCENKKIIWCCIFYYLINFNLFFFQLIGLRQGIAISLFLISTIFLYEKEHIKYVEICLLGFCFHKSILLIGIFLYFFNRLNYKKSKYYLLGILAIVIIGVFELSKFIFLLRKFLVLVHLERYNVYLLTIAPLEFKTGFGFLSKIILLIFLLIILFNFKFQKKDDFILKNIILMLILSFLSLTGVGQLSRIGIYLLPFSVFLVPVLIKKIRAKKLLISFYLFVNLVLFTRNYYSMIEMVTNNNPNYTFLLKKYNTIFNKKNHYKNKIFFGDKDGIHIIENRN